MATSSPIPYEVLRSDLAKAIRSHRTRCPPVETARLLLRYDSATTALLGLSSDGERAVFHDRTDHQTIACRYDATGLIGGSGVRIAAARDDHGLRQWIAKMGSAYWGWLHPRYRDGPEDL